MKIHELAKDYDMKAVDFLKKLQGLGYDFTSHAQDLNDGLVENVRTMLAKKSKEDDPENKRIRELSMMTMVGMFYDMETGKYQIATLRILPEEHEKYGVQLSKTYTTVDHASRDVNLATIDAGLYSPSELEKVRKKRLTADKK